MFLDPDSFYFQHFFINVLWYYCFAKQASQACVWDYVMFISKKCDPIFVVFNG